MVPSDPMHNFLWLRYCVTFHSNKHLRTLLAPLFFSWLEECCGTPYIIEFILTFGHRKLRDAIHLHTLRWSHSLTFRFLAAQSQSSCLFYMYISYIVHENNPYTSASSTKTMMFPSLLVYLFCDYLFLSAYSLDCSEAFDCSSQNLFSSLHYT